MKDLDTFLATIPAMTVEKKVKLYVKTREAKAALMRQMEAAEAEFKAIMQACEMNLLADADKAGVTGFKTEYGTTYTGETTKISIADDTAFEGFLDALPPGANRYGFFERRVSSRQVEEYMKLAEGTPPPGLNIFRERVMRIRKAADK